MGDFVKYTYKRVLKHFLEVSYSNDCDDIYNDKYLSLYDAKDTNTYHAIEYMAAKGLIIKRFDITHSLYSITITKNGKTFFQDERQRLMQFWMPTSISIISTLIAVISLICSMK